MIAPNVSFTSANAYLTPLKPEKKGGLSSQIWLQARRKVTQVTEVVNDVLSTTFHLLNLAPLRDLCCFVNCVGVSVYTFSNMWVWKHILNLFENPVHFWIFCWDSGESYIWRADCDILKWKHPVFWAQSVPCEMSIIPRECFFSLGYDFSVWAGFLHQLEWLGIS